PIKGNEMSTKRRDRFEKVASNRVQKIIDTLNLLGNCANKNNYEYTEKDVELMFREINKSLKETKLLFDKEMSKTNKSGFKF
ncbi:MAG: hypothetical protein KDC56_04310, partial [Flavobacteriaceae bacterium]|nr:hypothetical protein [Flavobacteriaceae bacterium]